VTLRFDEFEHGLEWVPEDDKLARTGHALLAGGSVWLTDVVDGPGLVEGAPFVVVPIIKRRFWREVALWFAKERVLVCGDALGSLGYFRAKHEPFGVHPFLRLFPPRKLAALEPEHILFGHGPGFHGPGAPEALREALAKPRRRLPQALLNGLREARRR
jgi:hypothetical protein